MRNVTPTQYITDKKGNKIAVIVSFIDYQKMVADLHDLSVITKRKKEPTISYETLKAKLKK